MVNPMENDETIHLMDLTSYTQWKQARNHKVYAYFYMRGVEAYMKNITRTPYYQGDKACQNMWDAGWSAAKSHHDEMVGHDIPIEMLITHFMRGRPTETSKPLARYWGLHFRYEFERKYGDNPNFRYRRPIKPMQYAMRLTKPNPEKDPEMKPNDQILYQIKDSDTYGYLVGKRRDGKMLFEPKGAGEIRAVTPDDIEEVIPYTIYVKSQYTSGHVEAEEDKFAIGDVVVFKCPDGIPSLGTVTKTDTKCKGAAEGSKIVGKVAFVETVAEEAMQAVAAKRQAGAAVSVPASSVEPKPETD